MSIRKTGSRTINVDGLEFRWRIRRKATYDHSMEYGTLTIAVESAARTGSVLVAYTNHPHPDCWPQLSMHTTATPDPITPKHVAECIRQALCDGWHPEANGPQFVFRYDSTDGPPFVEPAS